MTDPAPPPDRDALSPVQRRAHADLHAAVTALLNGDDLLARSLVGQSRQPVALATAAIVELASAIETLAQVMGADPQGIWTAACEVWTTRVDI